MMDSAMGLCPVLQRVSAHGYRSIPGTCNVTAVPGRVRARCIGQSCLEVPSLLFHKPMSAVMVLCGFCSLKQRSPLQVYADGWPQVPQHCMESESVSLTHVDLHLG